MVTNEKQTGLVYMITSPTGRLYVGSTINLKRRLTYYKNLHCKAQSKLYNSFKKYGFDTHKIEIVWKGPIEDMRKKEAQIALNFNTLDEFHLNCKIPKLGDKYKAISNSTRKKMSAWQIGRKMSKESKLKMSEKAKGKVLSKETKRKIAIFNAKPILQYDKKLNFIKEWESAAQVQRVLNINASHIRGCCNNKPKRKTAGGFIWKNK